MGKTKGWIAILLCASVLGVIGLKAQDEASEMDHTETAAQVLDLISLESIQEKGLAQALNDELVNQVEEGDADNVAMLLSCGAQGDIGLSRTALNNGDIEVLDVLIQQGRIPLPENAMLLAARNDDLAMAEYILQKRPNFGIGAYKEALKSSPDIAALLEEQYAAGNQNLNAALVNAVNNKLGVDFVAELIKLGADPQVGLNASVTMKAVQWDVFELLVESGADINQYRGIDGPVEPNEVNGSYPILHALLVFGLTVRYPSVHGPAITFEDNVHYMKRALELGADNELSSWGTSLLHDSVALQNMAGRSRMFGWAFEHPKTASSEIDAYMQLFIDEGADVNQPASFKRIAGMRKNTMIHYGSAGLNGYALRDDPEGTPLQWAIDAALVSTARFLVENGADTSVLGYYQSYRWFFYQYIF